MYKEKPNKTNELDNFEEQTWPRTLMPNYKLMAIKTLPKPPNKPTYIRKLIYNEVIL